MTEKYTLTVYLGSSGYARDIFKDTAIELGKAIAQNNMGLIYGGMDAGLMGLIAYHAAKNGAPVTGVIPTSIKDSERILHGLTETVLVDALWERKKIMFDRADALIILAGGFGTLDELAEVLYWKSKKLHNKPIIIVNTDGYWNELLEFFGNLPDYDPSMITVVETVPEIFPYLQICTEHAHDPHAELPHFEDEILRDTDQPLIIDKASIENTYFALCALGLKQIGKHNRPVGVLNEGKKFTPLINWIKTAEKETFVTSHSSLLFDIDENLDQLQEKLAHQNSPIIDLHNEKWGATNIPKE